MYGFRMKQGLANRPPRLDCGRKQVAAHDVFSSNNLNTPTCLAFGAVCPSTGATKAIIAPCVSMNIMRYTSRLYQNDPKLDAMSLSCKGATWHQHYLAEEFTNLSIIKLPPYSPELNSIEQVWQWLRQNELANRYFEGYEDIVEQCSRAWNSFIRYSKRIARLCSRNWIKVRD
jgi:hypothetical protein